MLAPFAGEVSQRAVDEGAVIGNGQAAISLVENSAVEARIGLPVAVARTLSIGEQQSVKVGDRTYLTVVSAQLPAIEQDSQTITVVLNLAGDRGLWSIYVLGKRESAGYRVARRDVEVLYTEGDRTFVRGLVEAGDRIITSGTHRMVAGQLVQPKGE